MARLFPLVDTFNPEQLRREHEHRAQVARKVRVHLRSMEPVVVLSPRWSQPMAFLEELALDLIGDRPALDCRTVRFRGLSGRALPEVWNHLVDVFQRLLPSTERPEGLSLVANRHGFRWSLKQLLDLAHRTVPRPVALLACEAEYLPLAVIEDVVQVWEEYHSEHPLQRRCVLLLAGSVQAHWLRIGDAPRIELGDYSEQEAAAALTSRQTPQDDNLFAAVAQFTGGIPDVVDRFSAHYTDHGDLPGSRDALLQILGSLGDEMRGVVDIIAADSALSERLEDLLEGRRLPTEPLLDEPLRMAGLIRTVSTPLRQEVQLRAPAIAALLG